MEILEYSNVEYEELTTIDYVKILNRKLFFLLLCHQGLNVPDQFASASAVVG